MSLQGLEMTRPETAMDEVHARVRVLAKQIERQQSLIDDAEKMVAREKDVLASLSTRFTQWVELAGRLDASAS
jgi:hypothetical protein